MQQHFCHFLLDTGAKRHFSWTCLLSGPTRLLQGELLKRWTLFSSFCMLRFFLFIYSCIKCMHREDFRKLNFFPSLLLKLWSYKEYLCGHASKPIRVCEYIRIPWCAYFTVVTVPVSYKCKATHRPRKFSLWSRTIGIWQSVFYETPSVTCKSLSNALVGKTFPEVFLV